MNRSKKIHRGGSQLLALMLVLAIAALVAPAGMEQYSQYMARKSWKVSADQFNTVQDAALSYIKDDIAALQAQVSPGKPAYISLDMLRKKGYLPVHFGANPQAQSYLLAVVAHPRFSKQLQAFLLTTGGTGYDFGALRHIARDIQGMGGYVWDNSMATGADGGWKIPLQDYGISNRKGTLVSFISSDTIGNATQDGDRLYRYAVNNRPDLNRMHTAIDMGNNDLNNTNTVNAKNGNYAEGVTANGDIRSKRWLNTEHDGGFYRLCMR